MGSDALTVKDVLNDKPSFRDVARRAWHDKEAFDKAVRDQEAESLRTDLLDFFEHELGWDLRLSEPDIRQEIAVSGRAMLTFDMEGVFLRCQYVKEKIITKTSDTFGSETVYDDVFRVEVKKRAGWVKVSHLYEIGAAIYG